MGAGALEADLGIAGWTVHTVGSFNTMPGTRLEQDGVVYTQFSQLSQGVLTSPWVCQLSDTLPHTYVPQTSSRGHWVLPVTQVPSSHQPLGASAS